MILQSNLGNLSDKSLLSQSLQYIHLKQQTSQFCSQFTHLSNNKNLHKQTQDQRMMQNDKQFSLQSTEIAQNPQFNGQSLLLSRVKSQKILLNESTFQKPQQTQPLQMLKTVLKLLQLNHSQQQFIITHVKQFKQQNQRQKSIKNQSSSRRTNSIDSKKKPPLPTINAQKRLKPIQFVKKISLQQSFKQLTLSQPFIAQNPLQLTQQSLIVKKIEQAQALIKMFPQNSVKSFEFLFRASQHKFNLKQFFKTNGSAQNLIFICKTNKDKIIGAYSSLSHEFTGKESFDDMWGQKVKDSSKSSFIFSLTSNDKFEMKKESQAIYRWRDKKYIIFGDWQFAICDSSNTNRNSRTDNVNTTYFNSKYKNSKESWVKFNGNQDAWFTTKEWEAWKVELQKN